MNLNKKPHRYQINDPTRLARSNKVVFTSHINRKNFSDPENKSLEFISQNLRNNKNTYGTTIHDTEQKKSLNKMIAKQRNNLLIPRYQTYKPNNESQQTIKLKSKGQSSIQKRTALYKNKNFPIKSPDWLRNKKKQGNLHKQCKEHSNLYDIQNQDLLTASTNQGRRFQPGTMSSPLLQQQFYDENRLYRQRFQSHMESQKNSKTLKFQALQIANIKLQQQNKQLKYRLQSLQEDNNILLCRIQTLQAELSLTYKKLNDYISRQEYHRNLQAKFKQKIEDLQAKLILAKDQINCKNQSAQSAFNDGLSLIIINDRQIAQKKSQQIQRLNQIINKTRSKVNQLNHCLSDQRINNLQNNRKLQQKYQQVLQKKEHYITELKKTIEQLRKQKATFNPNYQQIRLAVQNQQFLKKAISTNNFQRQLQNNKFSN